MFHGKRAPFGMLYALPGDRGELFSVTILGRKLEPLSPGALSAPPAN